MMRSDFISLLYAVLSVFLSAVTTFALLFDHFYKGFSCRGRAMTSFASTLLLITYFYGHLTVARLSTYTRRSAIFATLLYVSVLILTGFVHYSIGLVLTYAIMIIAHSAVSIYTLYNTENEEQPLPEQV